MTADFENKLYHIVWRVLAKMSNGMQKFEDLPRIQHDDSSDSPRDLTSPSEVLKDPGDLQLAPESHGDEQEPTVSSFLGDKPMIADFKILKSRECGGGGKANRFLSVPDGPPKESWSAEAIHHVDILSDLKDEDLSFRFRNRASTFVNPANNSQVKQSVYLDLGEYQTLLKHGTSSLREEDEDGRHEGDDDNGGGDGRTYNLPQPQCYSEDTLKAVHTITQRFDSFKLRQLRVRSFRDTTGSSRRRSSNSSEKEGGRNSRTSDDDDSRSQGVVAVNGVVYPAGRTREQSESGEDGLLTEKEAYRIEVFYKGQEAEVFICRCLADVFIGASTKPNEESHHWVQTQTGVPVLLLNTGMGLRPRELVLLVAQKDTGLPLWQDKINYLSRYHESSPGIHTMKVSGSLSKSVQLRMIDVVAAKEFMDRYSQWTSDPDDELWKLSAEQNKVKNGRRKVQKKQRISRIRRHLVKTDISQPCDSRLLTRVDVKDHNFRSAFNDILPALKLCAKLSNDSKQEEEFRPRLPTR